MGARLEGVDAIDPDLTLKGLAILHAEVARRRAGSSWGCRDGAPADGRLEGRLIALGVTGSIAAYKAAELLRLLRAEGADVVVLLTPVGDRGSSGPLTFAALTRHPVETDVLALLPDGRIGHIVVADCADAIVVAPATAHWLGAMANGLAGDVVTAAASRPRRPVVVAPAMDGDMWTHPATQANVARCATTSATRSSSPESGALASGQSGVGRLAELPTIVEAVVAAIGDRPVRAAGSRRARPPLVGRAARRRPRRAGTSSSPPAARASRSTPSASSATARPAGWASRSPRPRSIAARRSRSIAAERRGAAPRGRDDRSASSRRRSCERRSIG